MNEYNKIKEKLAKGWNTWNTRSVLSHVLLPEGLALNLCFISYEGGGAYLREGLVRKDAHVEQYGLEKINLGQHAYDGSYTELTMKWKGSEVYVQSAVQGGELFLMVTPIIALMAAPTPMVDSTVAPAAAPLTKEERQPMSLVLETGILWNRKGALSLEGDTLQADFEDGRITVFPANEVAEDIIVPIPPMTPYLTMHLDGPIGITTGKRRTLDEIKRVIDDKRQEHSRGKDKYGELAEAYNAMQSCLTWDTIYDYSKDRIITTVSRPWNCGWWGYALFCWDTYFAACMLGLDNKELAYANAIEITREKTADGFVPNIASGKGWISGDRSQPPVGAITVWNLYRQHGDKWLLEEVFDDLYAWNTWWLEKRQVSEGLLAWGSDPFAHPFWKHHDKSANTRQGAAFESGLDNSPMYDDIPFNENTHMLELADAGLTGLFVADANILASIAEVLGRDEEALVLKQRAAKCKQALQGLWSEEKGIFLNRRTDTGEFSERISPTNFYPMLGGCATQEQAERMMKEHFYNPEEFWGDWIMPSIARNDPAYKDQNYWRGRIWAPMNFLVYLGLRNYDLPQAAKDMADKSKELLLKEWLESGHIHENYCGDTGVGCNSLRSDPYYHWGALLSLIAFMEEGYMDVWFRE